MCGIAGFWRPNDDFSSAHADLEKMTQTLFHRGPDGNGDWQDPGYRIAMGHTRLTIIDLETGEQPFVSRDKNLALTANGEFYDYKRIRAELACRGHRFQSRSDSEIAIPLYRESGLDFVQHLRGEFAFALFDRERKRLVLVRDRFGIKPLYFRFAGGGLWWGSEVKSILAHPDVPEELDEKAAINQMMQVMVPGTTAFKGIQALKPGHMLIAEQRNGKLEIREKRWWDFVFPEQKERDKDIDVDYWVDGVRDRLLDAVATRLEADVPVGCYLSGGIDSCSILGLATRMQQSPVKAFTISFDDDAYDEQHIAKQMAEDTEADQEILNISSKDLYGEFFETVVHHTERTFYNTLAVAKWHMSKRVRECGYKVVITGEGADELFAGYPFLKRDLYLHGENQDQQLQKELDAGNQVFTGAILAESQQQHPAWQDLCGFTPSWMQPWMLTLEAVKPLLSPQLRDILESYDPVAAVAEQIDPDQLRGRHPLDIAQYTWSKTMLEGQILTWGGDRVDMANSMEARPAFLDHHLAEFAALSPPEVRVRNGIEKWVLREAMKGVLPEVLYKRQKFAFMAPPATLDPVRNQAMSELRRHWLSDDRIADAGLFDVSAVNHLMDEKDDDPTRSRRRDIIANHLLGLQILYDHYVGNVGSPALAQSA